MRPTNSMLILISHIVFLAGIVSGQNSPEASAQANLSLSQVHKTVSPAVVAISNIDYRGAVVGQGTGFIVRENGLIATNFHVIDKAHNILVKFKNGSFVYADGVSYVNKEMDLALVKVAMTDLPIVRLPQKDAVEIGSKAIAIGNPFGLEGTLSEGIVSQIRTVADSVRVIQITTPIAPGSSGGPLLNEYAEAIGITTAIFNGPGSIGFAIPTSGMEILKQEKVPKMYTMAEYAAVYGAKPPASVPRLLSRSQDPQLQGENPGGRGSTAWLWCCCAPLALILLLGSAL